MSDRIRFKLNLPGLNELMKSGEMQALLNDAAGKIAAGAGEGYEVEAAHAINFVGIASVRAATWKAKKDNSENDTLYKAAGGIQL